MAQSIFTTEVPAVTNGDDGVAYTLGTEFSRSTDGTITHGRWYFPDPVPTGTTDFVLYAATGGASIARASFVSPVAGAWNTAALASPVAYTAGTSLVACVRTSGMYVATSNFFTVDLVNGDITAPAATNGRLDVADQFPGNVSGSKACFFADVVFDDGGGVSLSASASGGSTSAGSASVEVVLAAAASGGSTSDGSAAVRLTLAVSASGGSTSSGSAVLVGGVAVKAVSAPMVSAGGTSTPTLTARYTSTSEVTRG